MDAWLASPYRAIGNYIDGAQRACDQPNLTADWVARQAADDAAEQAAALGFGPRTPLYYDMEAYQSNQTGAALAFESAWTRELHVRGYASGYTGGSRETYGGVQINIDHDYLDVNAPPGSTGRTGPVGPGSPRPRPICTTGAPATGCGSLPESGSPRPRRS
jgi:Domain of unknown function (DUF1906)